MARTAETTPRGQLRPNTFRADNTEHEQCADLGVLAKPKTNKLAENLKLRGARTSQKGGKQARSFKTN